MKTLHLTNYWHSASGGIATFYRALISAAVERDHQIVVVAPSEESRVEQIGKSGRIVYLKASRAPFNKDYRLLLPHRFLLPGGDIARLIAQEKPDLVEVCDKYTLNYLAGLLRKQRVPGVRYRPCVAGLSCERMDDNIRAYLGGHDGSNRWVRLYLKWLYFPLFDFHITVSQYTAAELREASRGHQVPRGVWVQPMGVDLATFSPTRRNESVRERLLQITGGIRDAVLLFYCGRLAPEKNPQLLLEVVEQLAARGEPVRLIVAGEGPMRGALEWRSTMRVPSKTFFLGHVGNRAELADIEANCDVFVHPNPREPFGIAPLEAMASGLPVVAPDSGGVLSYAGPANAWLSPPTATAYAASIRRILADPEDRSRRVGAALQTAAEYSWPGVASRFLDLYAQLHARNTGQTRSMPLAPDFVSTPGSRWGTEISPSRR